MEVADAREQNLAPSTRETPPHLESADAILDSLQVTIDDGLSADEAARRLEHYGPNELRHAPPTPLWKRIIKQFQDPLVYLLVVAIAISLGAWIVEGMNGIPIDATVIAVILVLNAVIGLGEELKAAGAVASLAQMTRTHATVVRGGRLESVPSSDLVPGDILALSEGDAVGADARLLTATGLKVQEASLTGESEATVKDPALLSGRIGLGDRKNMVFKGTAVVEGVGRAAVVATGMKTEMGAIAEMLDSTSSEPSPLERELARVSKTLGMLVVGIAAVVMVALYFATDVKSPDDIVNILLIGVSLAVAAVPEGLVAILSLVLAIGVRAMAKRKAILKDLHSVETLGSASVICTDKTGTLTRGEMTLREIVTHSGRVELTGSGYDPHGDAVVIPNGGDEGDLLIETRALLIGGVLANNSQLSNDAEEWSIQGDPTEAAFLVAQGKVAEVEERASHYERLGEIPFTSDRKIMSVGVHHDSRHEDRLYSKGAPDVLLPRCTSQRVGDRTIPLTDAERDEWAEKVDELNNRGYRTLAVAYKIVTDRDGIDLDSPNPDNEEDFTLIGVACIIDPPRDEVKAAIKEAVRAGIRPIMITGDHPVTARRIASDLGVSEPGGAVLTGIDLDELTESEFSEAVAQTNVFARVAPSHKLRIVAALQEHGHTVSMTGDGVNDAPALKAAEIGVAMGITGTEVTKEAADMILGDDNYATIVAAVRQGRVIYANIAKFLRYLLSSNLGEVVTVFVGVVAAGVFGLVGGNGAVVVPLLATQILWINLVTDSAPALTMGVDPEIDDVMANPPRPKDAKILDLPTWINVIWVGTLMGILTLLTIDMFLPGGFFEGSETVALARTAGFTTLVFAQLVNAFCARSLTVSAFHSLFSNHWLWAATAFGIFAQIAVVHWSPLQSAFGTVPLSLEQWLICVGMSLVVLLAQEVVKIFMRAKVSSQNNGRILVQ